MGVEEQFKNAIRFIPDTSQLNIGEAVPTAEAVPSDHARFVYASKYWNLGPATILSIYESVAGVLRLKDQQLLTQNQTLQWPQAGPAEETLPLGVFRSSSFIVGQISGVAGVTVSGVGVNLVFLDKFAGGG